MFQPSNPHFTVFEGFQLLLQKILQIIIESFVVKTLRVVRLGICHLQVCNNTLYTCSRLSIT